MKKLLRTSFFILNVACLQFFCPPAHAQTATPVSIYPTSVSRWYPIQISGAVSTDCTDVYVSAFSIGANESRAPLPGASGWASISKAQADWTWYYSIGGYDNGTYSAEATAYCSNGTHTTTSLDAIHVQPEGCSTMNCVPVYRFYNYRNGTHFFTTSESERRQVLSYSYEYKYEGIAYFAQNRSIVSGGNGFMPVHRFYNYKQGVHFFTANQIEASQVGTSLSHTYRYEGVAYYAFSAPHPVSFIYKDFTAPVHRFYKFSQGVHFFTSSQQEASQINNMQFNTYRYEGEAFHAVINQ